MAPMRRTRREWLIGMAAGLTALVPRNDGFAAPFESVPGYGSKDEFKRDCAKVKGSSWDEGKYSTACTYKGIGIKVCDEHGKNCTWHPPAEAGGHSTSPFDNPLDDLDSMPVLTADPDPGIGTNGSGHSKPRKTRGKRRKR